MHKRERRSLLDEIGGEPLEDSGFEDEDPAFDEQFAPGADPEEDQQ